MKKTALTTLLLLLMSQLTISQTTESILGKWKFKSVPDQEKLDSVGQKMLKQFFGKYSLYLGKDGHYKSVLIAEEEGKWSFAEKEKLLTLTANKGVISTMTLSMLDSGLLALTFDKDKTIVLERTAVTNEDEKVSSQKTLKLTSATKEQICKKWYFQGREKPGTDPEILKTTNEMFKGACFHFKQDNSYETKTGKIEDTGTWAFENNNQTIIQTAASGEKKYWQIKTISETQLVLVRGNSEEIWSFSASE